TGSQCGWLQSCTIPHGNDTIHARDGESDSIDCGVGTDTAIVDASDVVANCETVDKGGSTGPHGPHGPHGPGCAGQCGKPAEPVAACKPVKVRGLTLKAAKQRLAKNGCATVAVKRVKSRKVKRGRAIAAKVSGGKVTLTVSRGRR
ncbi:MAG: hypothetical protein M3389_06160, partial [Actinomycetota bacterium]|nr:hypothetical protein [Actinomycetota bacterium]